MTDIKRIKFKVDVVFKVEVKVRGRGRSRGSSYRAFGVSSFATHSLAHLWLFLVFVSSRDKICGREGPDRRERYGIIPDIYWARSQDVRPRQRSRQRSGDPMGDKREARQIGKSKIEPIRVVFWLTARGNSALLLWSQWIIMDRRPRMTCRKPRAMHQQPWENRDNM